MNSSVLNDSSLFHTANYINGRWIDVGAAGEIPLFNPSTGKLLGNIPQCDSAQVAEAIATAHVAFGTWRKLLAKERSRILRRWHDLIIENVDDLARLIVLEEGKPFAEAQGEVRYGAAYIEWFAEEAKRVKGDVVAATDAGRRIVTLKEPVGVCVAITPWNFPAAMITRKAAPALAAGCTMVVKPAEQTPLTAFALADLAERAGIPAGVLSVVTGDARTVGAEFTSNPLARKITFTGSTEVGRILIAQSAPTIKKMSMELGGNAPFLIFDNADIELAVEGLLSTKFRNTGQACVSANRIYVQDGVYDRFAKALTARVATLQVGDGFEPGVQQGPLIDANAVTKVEAHIADAVGKGATIAVGGKRHERGGNFFLPTVLTDVTADMVICREETFGPIAPLIRFTDEADAIRMANDTEFGLAAYLFAKDAELIWRVATALETGMVGINTGMISSEAAPFGGVKQSGLGREGSVYGIDEYLELKYLAWQGADPI